MRDMKHLLNGKNSLSLQLTDWLESVPSRVTAIKPEIEVSCPNPTTRAIISPHAGYAYCGKTAAFAYKSVDTSKIKRVFLLGPSHHEYFEECSLSSCDEWETPVGNLIVDKEIVSELRLSGDFVELRKEVEEDEHSLEMQAPFLAQIFRDKLNSVKIVPIMVGNLTSLKEYSYGRILSKYLDNPENLFVISSDFCHWGSRFDYTAYSIDSTPSQKMGYLQVKSGYSRGQKGSITKVEPQVPIYQSITNLDYEAFDAICNLSHQQFDTYLKCTHNTICGRHPISILLSAIENSKDSKEPEGNGVLAFIDYSKSENIIDPRESSVSYAAGVFF
ncbi:Protein MEMO1 [Smittium mucronatum]|uniref:Protein MEMO1 n=1 Tax=Smittium mucronatum TaxID=133383 RepID=A0A1R0H2H8_9FUNG|nr:Protein MEMO1 [Smittium mucronatum]